MNGKYKRIIDQYTDIIGGRCREHRAHTTQCHMAVVMRRGKVLAMAQNRMGTRSSGCGFSNNMIHAERAVIKKVGDTNLLKGAILCVWRVSPQNLLPSKPCGDCTLFLEKCMREYGLRAVYYTDTILPFA